MAIKSPMLTFHRFYLNYPLNTCNFLFQGARATVDRLFEVISALEPMPETVEQDLIQRAISTLTHQNMLRETDPVISPSKSIVRRTSNDTGLMRDSVANKLMVFFLHLIHEQMQKLSDIAQSQTLNNGRHHHRNDEYDEYGSRSKSAGSRSGSRPASAKGHTRTPPVGSSRLNSRQNKNRISEVYEEED